VQVLPLPSEPLPIKYWQHCINRHSRSDFSHLLPLQHALLYKRAHEFVEVVTKLWESWDDDALLYDKESGIFFDPDKLHVPNHKGDRFSVRGPLNVARSIQGKQTLNVPLLGSSGGAKSASSMLWCVHHF